jgi:outer membrane protein assembly factor BamE (lipoprotein component of BamABCDE complex)
MIHQIRVVNEDFRKCGGRLAKCPETLYASGCWTDAANGKHGVGDTEMEKRRNYRFVLALGVIAGLLPLAGCLVWNSDVSYGEKGAPLSGETLDQIQSGETTKDWVIVTLGEPSEQSTLPSGAEILKYRYSRSQENNVVLPFFIINDEKKNEQTVYFEISDGVVQRYWTECGRR